MAQPPAPTRYGLITDSEDDFRLSQERIDQQRLATERSNQQKAAEKRRQEALNQHLSKYADDPLSKAVATIEFEKTEAEENRKAQIAARQKEHDKISAKYDDPIAKAWAIMQYDDEQTKNLGPKQAFADREALQRLNEREDTTRKLDWVGKTFGLGIGDAFVRETAGSAVNVVPDLAAVPARAMEAVGLAEPGTADELHRQSGDFQQGRQEARRDDLSPWLSRMYGGASQSALQMAATPGGATSKIVAAGVMSGDAALTTGKDAGLEGVDLARYAGTQGLLEAGVAAIGQKIFGPGIESRMAGQAVAAETMKQLAKNIGKDAIKEMPEEVVTSILQDISSKYEGVSPDMTINDFVSNSIDAAVQSALMAGMANAPNAARLVPPAIKAFTANPSRKAYEAAVAAGMPPLEKSTTETRAKYAEDLLKAEPVPPTAATPPAATPDPATLEPTVQIESPPATVAGGVNVPVNQMQEIPNAEETINQVEAQGNQVAGANGTQGQEGQQELLTESPAGTQVPAPPAAVNDSPTPAAHTKESFTKEYEQAIEDLYDDEDVPGLERLAALWESNPEWAKEIDDKKTPPVVAPGGALPDQPSSPMADPVSTPETPKQLTKDEHAKLPMFDVYPLQRKDGTKFAVKESDKSGFGDAFFSTEDEAKKHADIVRQQSEERAAQLAKDQADEEATQKKQQEHEASFQGFLTDDPKTKGRRLKTLDSALNYKNKPTTRKALVEQKVSDGWTVNDQDQLQAPTGEFLDAGALTKTGIDYARHLVSKSSNSEKAVPWRRTVDEERPAYNKRLKKEGWTPSPKPDISVIDSPGTIKRISIEQQKKSPYKKGDRVTVITGFSTDEMQIGGEVLEDSHPELPQVKVRVDSGKVHNVMAYYLGRDKPAEKPAETVVPDVGERQFVSGIPGADNINKQLGILTGDIKPSPDLDADAKLLMIQESSNPNDARSRMKQMGVEIVSEHPSIGAITGNPLVNFTIKLTDDKGPLWAIVADHGMRPVSGGNSPKVVGARYGVTHVSRKPMGPVVETPTLPENPQENKPKAPEPPAQSQPESEIEAAMAAELDRLEAEEAAAKKPKTPKAESKPAKTRKPRTKTGEKLGELSEQTGNARKDAAEAFLKKMKGLGLNSALGSINKEALTAAATMVRAYIADNTVKFADFVMKFAEDTSPEIARKFSDYLEAAWKVSGQRNSNLDPAGKVADILGPEKTTIETKQPEVSGTSPALVLVDSLETELLKTRGIDAKRLWELADKAYGGTRAEGKYGPSEAYDALETAINLTILDARGMGLKTPAGQVSPEVALKNLLDMQKQIVSQTNRSGTKDTMQQFSTPPAYSYVVSQFVNMDARDVVLEPSAGTGDLAVHALNQQAKVHVNELDPKRAEMLKAVQEQADDGRLTISTEDALQLGNIMGQNLRPSVVLMNPPFSREGQRMGDIKMSGNDRNHIDAAMGSLIDGGRLVAIIGAGLHGPSKGFTNWLADIAKKHNVRANIEVSRDVYKGYGTTFPTRVLVIDKGTPTPKDGTMTAQADSLEHLLTMTKGIRNDRNRPTIQPVAPGQNGSGRVDTNEGGQQPKVSDRPDTAASDSGKPNGNASGRPAKAPRRTSGTGDRNVADDTGGRTNAADSKGTGSDPNAGSKSTGGGTTDAAGEPTGNLAGESPKPRRVAEKRTEIDESVLFEPYQPSIVPFPNAKPHPTAAVESAAMAAVDYPEVNEVPNIDAGIIEDGRLSDVQLEFVALAAHAHNQLLPSGERTGILFGDGTGMGKGRGIPGVILHNWNEGRRTAIWMSKNGKLHSDAMREWEELGGNPAQVANLSDMPVDDAIDLKEGILFATYDTLKSRGKSGKTRESQVTDWLPADFDGVIAFDEAHLMGSDTAARAGVARGIQDKFPKARIVYASATAATEIDQLMFGSRLGLWGAATPFATAMEFAAKIGSAGVSAMESVALSLKAMGRYVSRSISFNDGTPDGTVGYKRLSHTLADHQVQMYDRLAEAWQKVIGEFENAMDDTGADNFARGFARGQFWSAHQRFFNDLVTSLQMPTVIESIEKDMEEGRSVVIQLTTTGAAQQARALAGRGTQSLDDFAVDPFSALVELVRSQFPTQAYEDYVKDDGSVGKRPVVDSAGKPVKDADAVAKQQQLLSDLAEMEQSMPDSPLDMILNYFGTENVAEVTGRSQRVVWQEQQDGTKKRVLEKRSQKKSNQADIDAFQEGKKRILVFSQAGGTGASYHADRRARNQQKRMHYLVQPGWVAADAIQGLGRTHRTNQKQAPEYILVQTDIPGQKRFISTIARRLTQLGALTRGQRTAGGSGVFEATDNLESSEAALALTEFFKSLENEDSVMTIQEFEDQTGLELRLRSTGQMKSDVNLPDITSFMNRMLSMKIESQNKVFDQFDTTLKKITEARRISGELDQGVETIKGSNIRKTRDEVVFTHDSGAKTRYVQLTMEVPIPSRDFATQSKAERFKDFVGYYKRKSDGRVFFVSDSFAKTTKSGQVVDMVRLVPPYGEAMREEEYTLRQGKLEKIMPSDAEALWNEQFGNRPKTKTQKIDMITGAVIPIWDRLPLAQPKLSRALTASGDMVLGVVLPPSKVNETLDKLGAEKNKVDVGETIRILRTGKGDVQLVNGWMIQRVRVQNEWRLEIVGPSPVSELVFQRQGVITERIGFKARYFIPVGDNTQTVFEAVTRGNPVQKVNRYDSVDSGDDVVEEPPAETPGTATPDQSAGSAEAPISDARQAAIDAKYALEEQRAKNWKQNEVIWHELRNLPPFIGAQVPKALARAVLNRMLGEVKAGVKTFDLLIKNLRADFSESDMMQLKPTLIAMWNVLREKKGLLGGVVTETDFDEAIANNADTEVDQVLQELEAVTETPPAESQNSEPPIAEPSTPDPATQPTATGDGAVNSPDDSRTIPGRWADSPDADEPTIGINKAKRAERRKELGLAQEDIVSKVGHSFPELDAQAKKVSPGEAEDVFTRIGAGGEAADNASDRDVFVMLNHYAGKLLATTETLNERKAAQEAGDDFRVVELDAKLNVQIAEEARLMAIAKNAGTAAGRALAAFKALMKYDMSLARLRMRLNAASDGNPTDAQTQEQIDLHAKYEAALKELEAKTKEAEEAIARAEIAEQIARRMKEKEKRDKAGGKVKTKADRRLDAALEKLGKDLSFFSFTGAFQKLPQLIELAGALIEKNMERFEDFVAWTSKRWGKTPKPETLPVLRQAWDTAWEQEKHRKPPSPPKVSVERDIPDSLVNAAKILFRHFLEEGITNTEEVIDAVHSELQDQFPNLITERLDTMKAMVDYEKTITLSQDPLDILAADKRAIVQLKAKIADMQRGIAPRRSEQRYPASDEQRAHIKMFNEEKRKGGFEVTDPDRQAKSALASLETRLRHSISDTLNEISSGARTVPEKTVQPTSDTTEDLQAYLALVRGMHKDIFGDMTMTQEQRLKAAEAAAVKNEAYWNERLARAKTGDFSTGKTKPDPVTSANIAAIKARAELAKAQIQELKELANPKPSPEAISDARYLTSLQNQLSKKMDRMADIMARAAAGDFAPERNLSKEKREANAERRKKDSAIRDARIKLDETSRALNDQIENVRKKNLTYVDLAKRVPGAAWATLRDMKLTGELSFILKQGGPHVFGTLVPAGKIARAGYEAITGNTDAAKLKLKQAVQGYPKLASTLARTLKAMLWKTDTELARSQDAIKQRPNYLNGTYEAMKIPVEAHGGKFSVAEEVFINNLIELGGLALDKRFPGFKGFRDGHPVFTTVAHNLNLANRISNATQLFMAEIRADMADDAAAVWAMNSGEITPAEARSFGNVVNAFTGKGDMGMVGMDNEKAQNFLSKIVISAPWLMSRMQLMALHPFWSRRRTPESQKAAAELYVDMAAGVAAYYGAFVLAGMFMADDDEDKPIVELDSRSTEYRKVRIGKTLMDPLFGLQQIIVLASRIYHGQIKDGHGVIRDRKGFRDDWELIARFQEGRLHPAIQDIRSLKTGEDFMGKPITKTEVAMKSMFPVTYPDIAEASKNRGIPASTAFALWAIAGGPLQTYDPRTKARADIVEELGIVQRKIQNQNTPADVRKSLQTDADKMLEEHLLNAVKHDMSYLGNTVVSEQLATREPGTPIAPELSEAIQKEKHDITLRALEMLSTEDTKKAKKPGEDNGITTARSLLRTMAPTYDEANALFEAAYKQRNGSLRELVGEKGHKRWQFKPSVTAARRRMKAIYETK